MWAKARGLQHDGAIAKSRLPYRLPLRSVPVHPNRQYTGLLLARTDDVLFYQPDEKPGHCTALLHGFQSVMGWKPHLYACQLRNDPKLKERINICLTH
jgi:hypothetical protein